MLSTLHVACRPLLYGSLSEYSHVFGICMAGTCEFGEVWVKLFCISASQVWEKICL